MHFARLWMEKVWCSFSAITAAALSEAVYPTRILIRFTGAMWNA